MRPAATSTPRLRIASTLVVKVVGTVPVTKFVCAISGVDPVRGPRRSCAAMEFAALEWADWSNTCRLLGPIGNVPPAEAETRDDPQTAVQAVAA